MYKFIPGSPWQSLPLFSIDVCQHLLYSFCNLQPTSIGLWWNVSHPSVQILGWFSRKRKAKKARKAPGSGKKMEDNIHLWWCRRHVLVVQGGNCFFPVDGAGFLWIIEDVAASIFSHQSHLKWTSGPLVSVSKRECAGQVCVSHHRGTHWPRNWQDGQSNPNKKTSLVTDQHSWCLTQNLSNL